MTNECWSFNTASNTWDEIAPYPGEPRNKTIAFHYENIIYFGFGASGGVNDSLLYSFNPATNSWTEIPGAPSGIGYWSASCFMIGSKAYIITNDNNVVSFDCFSGTWEQKQDFPGPARSQAIAFSINGSGYFGLGYPGVPPFLNDFWKYNPSEDTWTQIAGGFPGIPRYAAAGVATSNYGYIICGESQEAPVFNNDFWQFDPATETFVQLIDFPLNRNYLSSFCINNQIYAGCGGPGWNTDWWSIDLEETTVNNCQALNGSLTNGLVGYWPFCGNANDESGNGNDGVVNGATLTEDRFGNVASAYDFNAISSNILTTLEAPSAQNPRSFSLWFQTDSINNTNDKRVMLTYGGDAEFTAFDISIWNQPSFGIAVDAGATYIVYSADFVGSAHHHLAVTYDSADGPTVASVKVYLDGVLLTDVIAETASFEFNTGNQRTVRFGPNPSIIQPLQTFYGTLDDIGIWNRALTAEEVALLYGNFTQPVIGCTDNTACNFLASATADDGSCVFAGSPCDDLNTNTYNDILDASCGCNGTPIELGVEHTCGAPYVHNPNLDYGSLTDQEGNVYKTIVIGDQEWMAENLNTSIYRNGESILTGLDDATWSTTNSGAWAYYNNDSINACPYGKLYNWYTCVDSRELCPTGWRVPNDSDWTTLTNHLGGETEAGGKMKSYGNYVDGTGLWFSPNAEATNSSGFSAVPGGFRSSISGFDYFTGDGKYWSLFEVSPSVARDYYLSYIAGGLYNEDFNKHYGLSVRCLRNTENTGLIPGCTDPLAFNYNPQATVNEGCEYVATIFVYNDLNGNGTHEGNEPGLANWPVLGNNINGLLWTNGNGNAAVTLPEGFYEFTVLNTTDNWIATSEVSGFVSLGNLCVDQAGNPIPCTFTTLSFGLQVIPGEAIVAAGPFNGFWDILHCTEGYESGVYLENIGSQAVSGFMTLTCDPLLTPNSDSYFTSPPVEVGAGYALWNVEDFLPGEYELLSFHIDGPGVEYLNQSFTFAFDLTLFDPQGNMIYSDNWSVSPIVACAYDPNDITGFPEGLSAPHEEGYTIEHFILPDNMVEFRVRFQNTGTLPAEDIDIYIPIDPNQWELSTIFPLMRSAEMQVICLHDDGTVDLNLLEHELPEGITAQDLLIFSFDDIYLPDSASNPEGSQGYVYFRMQAKHTLSIGDEINAQAFIYFEQNPAVVTNETYHVIFDCTSFTPMVGDTELCAGEALQFSASQPNVDDYSWNIGSLEGSGNIFLFEGIDAGEYTLQLNTSNMLCPQGENHAVTVVVNDIPQLDVPLDETICEGEELTYEAESDGDVSWSNGASTGDVFTAEESFTVTAIAVGAGGCSTSADWIVTVNPLPSAEVDSANFVLTAADGVAWQWSVNGVLDATTQSINATENGNYQVEITSEFGCVAISDVVAVELPIPDNVFVHSWSTLALFPNPMTTSARLELPQGAFDIALYDLTGACVRTLANQQGTVVIERESLARGAYQVRISNGNDSRSIRLVIE